MAASKLRWRLRGDEPDGALSPSVSIDVSLPGISGIDALGRFLRLLPGLQVLMLSMHESDPFPELSLERGARGYLSKRYAAEELVLAVHQVAAGQHYVSRDIAPRPPCPIRPA